MRRFRLPRTRPLPWPCSRRSSSAAGGRACRRAPRRARAVRRRRGSGRARRIARPRAAAATACATASTVDRRDRQRAADCARCRASATSAGCSASAQLGSSGLTGDLNNICQPSLPDPEPANSGIDAMVAPPAVAGKQPATLYDEYGVAGRLLGRDQPAVLGHDVADRQQRRRHGLRRREVDRPGHDHGLPVGRGRGHPELAPARDRQADHQPRQRHLLPLPGRRRHPRRDLARLAGTDPQARRPARSRARSGWSWPARRRSS